MQPSRPLDDQVQGREVGEHQVEVHIQALLHNLGGDNHKRISDRPRGPRTEVRTQVRLEPGPLPRQKARVQQHHSVAEMWCEKVE